MYPCGYLVVGSIILIVLPLGWPVPGIWILRPRPLFETVTFAPGGASTATPFGETYEGLPFFRHGIDIVQQTMRELRRRSHLPQLVQRRDTGYQHRVLQTYRKPL